MTRRKADWFGWSLQFIVGFVVGAVLGFAFISKLRQAGWWVAGEVVPHFVLGAGLLAAAVASHFGDNLWMEYKVIPLDEPDQSRFSVVLSFGFGLIGVGLMAFAILRTLSIV